MWELVLGILLAIGASTLYSLGIVFQAMDAKRAPAGEHLRFALLWSLVRQVRWLFGTGLSILGWPLQVAALLLAPLVVVQPALAMGLLVLLFAGERMLGEPAGRNEHIAMAAIVIGVIAIGLTAPPRSTTHTSEYLTITIVMVCLGLASLLPYLAQVLHRSPASLTIIGAGLAFAWSGIATKLASDDLANGHLGVALAWGLSTAAASGVGVLSEMSALQSRPAIQVSPIVFVTQTVIPVVLAPLMLGEHFSATPYGGVPLALALALLIAGAAMLARSPLLLAVMEAESAHAPGGESGASSEPGAGGPGGPARGDVFDQACVSEPSGTARSPSAPATETIRSSPSTDAAEPSSLTTSTSPARSRR